MNLQEVLGKIQTRLRTGQYTNEAAVSAGVVVQILRAMDWPDDDPQIVSPQITDIEGGRPDYKLCDPPGKPVVLIEVKQVGQSERGVKQLFEYAFHAGIPMAVLTDGQIWNFYLPAEEGDYSERQVYKLDIIGRPIEDCIYSLTRYLSYENVRNREYLKSARKDLQDGKKNGIIERTLPVAWKQLVEEPDSMLVDLLSETVEDLCGFKPDPDTAAGYIASIARTGIPIDPMPSPGRKPNEKPKPEPRFNGDKFAFVLKGENLTGRSGIDIIIKIVERLSDDDPGFLERFTALSKHGSKRRYIARSKDELYPGRPDLRDEHSHQLKSGFWMGTNYDGKAMKKFIELACDVAGLKFGSDIKINFA